MPEERQDAAVAAWNARSQGTFPGLLGLEITGIGAAAVEGTLALRAEHLAPNGYHHAAVAVGRADTVAGYGCAASLPEGTTGLTTIELESNFLGAARGLHRRMCAPPARWPLNPGLGCRGPREGCWRNDRALPLHPDDPLPTLSTASRAGMWGCLSRHDAQRVRCRDRRPPASLYLLLPSMGGL